MKKAEKKAKEVRSKEKAKGKAASKANGKESIITISDAEPPSDINDQQMHSSPKRRRSGCDTVWMCTLYHSHGMLRIRISYYRSLGYLTSI